VTFICASLLGAAPAFAQVHVEVIAPPPPHVVVTPPRPVVVAPPPPVVVAPPTIRFAAPPPMVEVQPGVQVVRDNDEEIFFHGGFYWHCGPSGVWYRTRDYRGGWVVAPRAAVPVAVMHIPRGQYRHYRGEGWHDRHEMRREERAVRHEEHREQKAEQRWDKHHGRR
jgi:hypothetical protein